MTTIPKIRPTTFIVTLAAPAGDTVEAAFRRIRGMLKSAGRAHRLKCVSVVKVDADADQDKTSNTMLPVNESAPLGNKLP